jgi:CheY-like chemotaxis protein
MHGGEVAARSDGPGQGSEFLVRLPLTQNTTQPEKAARTAPATFAALTSRRILIVDDARDAVFVVGRLLEKMGQRVTTANSAAVALEQIRREQPDLIISDIAMPLMAGYEFARRLRALPNGDEIVLVALTGYGQDSDRQEARAAGFDYHLVKPVSMEALDNLLRSLPDKTEAEPTATNH